MNRAKKFPWGKVIDYLNIDLDGSIIEITKFHPFKSSGSGAVSGDIDYEEVLYHSEELHESWSSIYGLLISKIAHDNLGVNERSLVYGVCRALEIKL